MKIQDQDIALCRPYQAVHRFLVRLQQDAELFTQGRRKKWVKCAIFRVQTDLDHAWTTFYSNAVESQSLDRRWVIQ
jgi:hypothetical protein